MTNQAKIKIIQLLTVFELCKKIVTSKCVIPILDGYYVQIHHKTGKAVIIGTNLSNHIILTLDCVSDSSFEFYIPSKVSKFIQKLDEDAEVEFKCESEKGQRPNVFVSCGKDKTKFETYPVSDFPRLPKCSKYDGLMIVSADTLFNNVKLIKDFLSTDELREAIMGISIKPTKDKFEMAGTDANVLVKLTLNAECNVKKSKRQFIIPKEMVQIISAFPGAMNSPMEIFTGITDDVMAKYDQQIKDKVGGTVFPSPTLIKFAFECEGLKCELITRTLPRCLKWVLI